MCILHLKSKTTGDDIEQMITISSCHISKTTAEYLERQSLDKHTDIICYEKSNLGWFIYVPYDEYKHIHKNKEIPIDLKRLFKYAAKKQCTWLCIDRDGIVLKNFPIFDW